MLRLTKVVFFLFLIFILGINHNPLKPQVALRVTLVTAWWPEQKSNQKKSSGADLEAFKRLLTLPYNLIVFGEKSLAQVVTENRQSTNTVFYEHPVQAIKSSWYNKLARQLQENGQIITAKDQASSSLAYSRMILLGKANKNDPFDTDQFIWIDPNALNSQHIANMVNPKNLYRLLEAFSHNFFMIPVETNKEIHVLPNIEKTLYFQKFDTFVSSKLFGGKIQTIQTVAALYEDLLKVILEYDKNLWSEDVILGLLADRFPYTISYFSIQFKKSTQTRLLADNNNYLDVQQQQKEIQYYERLFNICQIGFIVLGVLITIEIFKYLNYNKQFYQCYSSPPFQIDLSQRTANQ